MPSRSLMSESASQVCGGVTVFPLFAERSSSSLDYLLSDEAMAAGRWSCRKCPTTAA